MVTQTEIQLEKSPVPKTTLERKPTMGSGIKAKELIDYVSPLGLSLVARRVYNILLFNAHTRLSDPGAEHVISLKELRNGYDGNSPQKALSSYKSNERIEPILHQLMSTIIEVKIQDEKGNNGVRRAQMLGGNDMFLDEKNGVFRYTFDPRLIDVLKHSTIYAQLRKEVLFAFESKYAMALYEMMEQRVNLKHIRSEEFTVERIRILLDVPENKLKSFGSLNQTVLKKASEEVNHLSDFNVWFEPIKTGRKITGVRFHWHKKDSYEQKDAVKERNQPRVGRRARRDHVVETVAATKEVMAQQILSAGQNTLLEGDEIQF